MTWDEQGKYHRVLTADAREHRFEAVICAVGMFSAPRLPDLPGLDTPAGVAVHTATWDETLAFPERRVAVMGTGSSATQVVASLAVSADQVHVFQRQPGWLLPKGDRDFTALERRIYRRPALWRINRLRLYLRQEKREFRGAFFRPGTLANRHARQTALRNIADVFADRPDLRALVTPTYPFSGKRAILSSSFYQSLLRPDVELIPYPVVACTPTGVVDSTGKERPVDVLVMATGFHAASYLDGLQVRGRQGLELHEYWAGEPSAFLGISVPGFPTSSCCTGRTPTAGSSSPTWNAKPPTQQGRSAGSAGPTFGRWKCAPTSPVATTPGCNARWAVPRSPRPTTTSNPPPAKSSPNGRQPPPSTPSSPWCCAGSAPADEMDTDPSRCPPLPSTPESLHPPSRSVGKRTLSTGPWFVHTENASEIATSEPCASHH